MKRFVSALRFPGFARTPWGTPLVVGLALTSALCGGCGDDGDGPASGGAAPTGGGGASGGTGSGGGGTGTGGLGAAPGTGGTSVGVCAPGYTTPGWSVYPEPFDNCSAVAGVDAPDAFFRDLTLDEPLAPGDTYAFSADLGSPAGRFEVYGATEKCGAVGELLDTVDTTGPGVVCHQVAPATGTYSHLIWVWYVAGEQGDTTFCSAGTCPGR